MDSAIQVKKIEYRGSGVYRDATDRRIYVPDRAFLALIEKRQWVAHPWFRVNDPRLTIGFSRCRNLEEALIPEGELKGEILGSLTSGEYTWKQRPITEGYATPEDIDALIRYMRQGRRLNMDWDETTRGIETKRSFDSELREKLLKLRDQISSPQFDQTREAVQGIKKTARKRLDARPYGRFERILSRGEELVNHYEAILRLFDKIWKQKEIRQVNTIME